MADTVAVIGSGLGGLTSAVLLARAGLHVILFERQPVTGGYAIQFKRQGFVFDPALHAVPAGGQGESFHNLMKCVGIEDRVPFIKLQPGPLVLLGNTKYSLPNEPDALFDYLCTCFPLETKNLRRFRKYIETYSNVYSRVLVDKVPIYKSLPPFLIKLPAFLAQSYQSTDVFFAKFFEDPVLKVLLFQYAIFMGIPMDEFPAVNFIMMVSLLMSKGMYSIKGGGGTLTRILTQQFTDSGGIIHKNTDITSIIVDKGRAVAVRCSKGNEYKVDAVVANTNMDELLKMTPQSNLPVSYVQTFRKLKPSISVVQLHIGLDCSVREFSIDRHLIFSFPDSDIDSCIKRQRESLIPEGFSVTAPGISDPELDSRYDRVLSIVGGVSGERWMALDDEAYKNAKETCRKRMLDQLEKNFPAIGKHIITTDLATPKTFHRYTGNPLGALMGFNCTCGVHKDLMTLSRFPLRNVFLASAWTDKLGGFMQCMKAGQDAAEKVIKVLS
jgi:all-trans-retinol 13,14-reductase